MIKHTHRLLTLVFLFAAFLGNAQSQAEKTLLKTASKQFEAQEFLAALPSYSQLLSIAPENKDYNFKYGVCLLASDEDVDRSLKHLKYVCTDGNFEDSRAYYYLGKAYHLNYQFSAALRSYEEFKSKADSKTLGKYREVDRLITMAENGKELMTDIKDIRVIDKTESTASDFFRNYDMALMGGSVIKVPEELLSSNDKKKSHSPVMFFPEGGGEIIFSSYGSGDHLELFSVDRKGNGGFSTPKKLEGVVNSPFDEDYPFLHSDGRTLYFSSKGHNSMGGYDVFKSKRDLSTGVFETPVNLDFAISSPDNDIFYMVDKEKRIANFASDRSSEIGRLHVYKVAVSNAVMEIAIIEGKLINTTGGNAIAQIKVLDANTDEEIGVYLTDEDGNYIIDLPGTGKYKFFVEAEDSQVLHSGLVDVPSFGQIMAFKQEMILSEESSQEKLVIKNQFDEEADLDVMARLQEVVKEKAQLDVNFDGEPEIAVEEEVAEVVMTESEVVSRAGFGENVSIASIVTLSEEQSTEISSRVAAEEAERGKAFARAIDFTERSEALIQEAEQLYQSAQSASTPEEKEELILKTSLKRSEAEKAANDAGIALVLAEEIDAVIQEKAVVLRELEERNASLKEAVESNDQPTIIARLEEVKSFDDKSEIQADALEAINERSIDSNREARKVIDRVEEIRSARTMAVNDITTKETQLEKAKKQKVKDILEAELSSLRAEVVDIDIQLERAATRLEKSQTDADNSADAVILLEQIRVGQMEELAALEPISIPQGGLVETDRRLTSVNSKSTEIEVNKEELGRILASRPELLANLSPAERQLLENISSSTQTGLTAVAAEGGETPSDVQGSEIADASEEIDDLTNPIESEEQSPEEEQDRSSSDLEVQIDQDPTLNSVIPAEEVEPEGIEQQEVVEDVSSLGIVTEDVGGELPNTEEPELEDYSSMTTTELLSQLQNDYESALQDIEESDMVEVEKSRANIDLNRAAVQVVDQKISQMEASGDYSSNEVKQGNVRALNMLANDLEADMLVIAAMTNSPVYPDNSDNPISALEQRADAINESIESDSAAISEESVEVNDIPVSNEQNSISLAAQLDRTDQLSSMEAEIESIQENAEMTRLIKSAAKVKSRSDFIEELKQSVVVDPELTLDEKEDLVALIRIQQNNLETDIQIWQVETGTVLTPAEMVMAKNDRDYVSQRTILETSIDTRPIEVLDYEVARRVVQDIDGLMILGVDFASQEEQRALRGFIEANTPDDEALTLSYESIYSEIAPLAEDRAWIAKLISDRDLQQQVMAIREEMALLLVYGDSEEDKFRRHIALNQEIAEPLRNEILWKEEELKVATKKNDVPEEVSNLARESYALSSRAKEIRAIVKSNASLTGNAEMLSKATLLDLSAIEKLEEACQMQKHVNKGRDITAFEFREAVVIDSGLLMEETETFASGSATDSEELVDTASEEIQNATDTPNEDVTDTIDETRSTSEEATALIEESIEVQTDSVVIAGTDEDEGALVEDAIDNTPVIEIEEDVSDPLTMESAEVELITDIAQLDGLARIEATEAVRDYPEMTAQLGEQDILPILSFAEVTSSMPSEEAEVDSTADWEVDGAAPEQLAELESKGVAVEKHKRYQSELQDKMDRYTDERQKRTVRLAEVIDQLAETGANPTSTQEAKRLTREIQIIDGYSRQAEINSTSTASTLEALEIEREEIVKEIEATVALQPIDESIPEETSLIDESLAAVPDEVIEEEATVEIENFPTPDSTEDVVLDTPEEEVVIPVSIPVAEPDYEAFVMPAVLNSDMFKVSVPSAERTRSIPVDVVMPNGTVYQVQVGAFRNPIPEAHFSEFDPIMGTRLDNGITRYKVGLFQDESTAIVARNQIRGMGYTDAFVVKYVDGSRDGIVSDAGLIVSSSAPDSSSPSGTSGSEANTDTPVGTSTPITADNTSVQPTRAIDPNDARSARPLTEYDSDNTAYYEESINAAPATQVERIEGLFYTVQVGVYSKPVTLASVFGITPLNSDLTSSGKIRYTSGIFDDAAVAGQWKQKIIERGVSDAFVTAYYNGNRISMNRAAELLSSRGQDVLVEIDKLNSLDTDRQGQAIWEMVSTSELFSEKVAEQIDFKIRMGPYYERIPDKDVKVILDFEQNVDYSQLSDGAIIYTTKGRMTYDQAEEWRVRFLSLGISNANIVALKEGVEIPVKQALDFLLK